MGKCIKDEKAVLADRRYEEEQPRSCKYCYFWEGKKKGCGLDQCYYVIPEDETEKEKPAMIGNCLRCPYGRDRPCIGYCIAKIQLEVRQAREKARGGCM